MAKQKLPNCEHVKEKKMLTTFFSLFLSLFLAHCGDVLREQSMRRPVMLQTTFSLNELKLKLNLSKKSPKMNPMPFRNNNDIFTTEQTRHRFRCVHYIQQQQQQQP